MAKNTSNGMNRVPPFMPILWQDWESDPDISTMTDSQVGIHFKMLLRQWIVGSVPANVSDIIRECKLDSRNTVLRFLESYPHLWTCDGCGADFVRTECGCSTDAARTSDGHSVDAARTSGGCSADAAHTSGGQSADAKRTKGGRRTYTRRTNRMLKNLRNDVNFGLELGTTKPNQTEPEPKREPKQEQDIYGGLPDSFESDSEASPAPQGTPVQPEPETSSSTQAEESPASDAPKKEKTPSERAARRFFKLLGEPKEHSRKGTEWSATISSLMSDARMELDEYREFLTWAVNENPMSAEYLRMAKDPVGSLAKNQPTLLRIFRAKKAGARAGDRKPATKTNPDAEQKTLDLLNSLSGQQ